ncbi:MAG: elongation factor G-binding protein, partial [Clostridium butyricum]
MEPFIKKHEYNFIKQCLFNLNNTFRGCIYNKIVETNKIYLQNKILNQFSNLSE